MEGSRQFMENMKQMAKLKVEEEKATPFGWVEPYVYPHGVRHFQSYVEYSQSHL